MEFQRISHWTTLTLTYLNHFLSFKGCDLYGFIGTLGALGEIWSLTAITYDRHQSILHPLNTSKRLKTKQVKFLKNVKIG